MLSFARFVSLVMVVLCCVAAEARSVWRDLSVGAVSPRGTLVFLYLDVGMSDLFRALKTKYEAEQKEMARLQGFVDRFGAQARESTRDEARSTLERFLRPRYVIGVVMTPPHRRCCAMLVDGFMTIYSGTLRRYLPCRPKCTGRTLYVICHAIWRLRRRDCTL